MTPIIGYVYQDEILCPSCVMDVLTPENDEDGPSAGWRLADGAKLMSAEANLDEMAVAFGIDRGDERSFGSGDFPKVAFQVGADEKCRRCWDAFPATDAGCPLPNSTISAGRVVASCYYRDLLPQDRQPDDTWPDTIYLVLCIRPAPPYYIVGLVGPGGDWLETSAIATNIVEATAAYAAEL